VASWGGEGCYTASAELAEHGQDAEQGVEHDRADAGHGGKQPDPVSEPGIVGDEAGDVAVEVSDLAAEQLNHDLDGGSDLGVAGAVTVKLLGRVSINRLRWRG
jgi:hypothetical protein